MVCRNDWFSSTGVENKLRHYVVSLALCLTCFSVSEAQTIATHKLDGSVVGQDGTRCSATVIEINCESTDQPQLAVRTDQQGHFLLSKEVHANPRYFGQGVFAVVFSEGQKIIPLGSGDVGDRSVKLQVQPDEPIDVQVLSEANKPIAEAKVLNGSGFSSFCRFDMLAKRLLENDLGSFVSRTNAEGRAMLRGIVRSELQNLAVGTPDGRWTQFLIPLSVVGKDTIELRVPNTRNKLSIQVKDDSGEVVPDAVVWLRTPGDAINKNTLTEAVPMEFRCGLSDLNGRVAFEDVSISEVEIWVFFAKNDGRNCIKRGVVLSPNVDNQLEVSLPPSQEISFSVIDRDRASAMPDVHFAFSSGRIGFDTTSNEDGIVVVRLPQGAWYCTLNAVSQPDGYVCATSADREIEVVDGKVTAIPPWVLTKGKVFNAEVRGKDLRQIKSNYVNVVTKTPKEWKTGKITADNRIRFTMPSDFSLDNIDVIYTTDGTEFKIVSAEPFVLETVVDQPAKE